MPWLSLFSSAKLQLYFELAKHFKEIIGRDGRKNKGRCENNIMMLWIYFAFRSFIRTIELCSKVLSLGNGKKWDLFCISLVYSYL